MGKFWVDGHNLRCSGYRGRVVVRIGFAIADIVGFGAGIDCVCGDRHFGSV